MRTLSCTIDQLVSFISISETGSPRTFDKSFKSSLNDFNAKNQCTHILSRLIKKRRNELLTARMLKNEYPKWKRVEDVAGLSLLPYASHQNLIRYIGWSTLSEQWGLRQHSPCILAGCVPLWLFHLCDGQ